MRRRRSFPPLLFLVLALLGGVAWLTRHPDAPILEAATRWPLVGPVAERFRGLYLPPPPARSQPGEDPGPIIIVLPPEDEEIDRRAEAEIAARDAVWLQAGTPLRATPDETAPIVAELPAIMNPTVVERAGDWVRVRRGALDGWVRLHEPPIPGEPPFGRAPDPVLPLDPRPPEPARLAVGRELLGRGERVVAAGPYTLYTDRPEAALEADLPRLAAGLEGLYARRLGLEPRGEPAAAILLFGRAEDFHAFRARSAPRVPAWVDGFYEAGLVALAVEGRGPDRIAATLAHELAHSLNRRAVGPALPPWLEEGLAEEIERLGVAVLIGRPVVSTAPSPVAAALAAGALPDLRRLAALDDEHFHAAPVRELHRELSGLWIRFLLSDPEPSGEGGFRDFLAAVADGEPLTRELLVGHLGGDWDRLEARFRGWLVNYGRSVG